ncbi:MAG TPA: hypothetical protein HPP56_08995 [Nitrospirae bacterium]|nr:hypothetical protein [Nitrospirota bacterium]
MVPRVPDTVAPTSLAFASNNIVAAVVVDELLIKQYVGTLALATAHVTCP